MSQSLSIDSSVPHAAGSSTKRQRSTDSRDPRSVAHDSESGNATDGEPAKRDAHSEPRMPRYLQKSRSDILATFQDLEWKQRFRLFHAIEHPKTSPYRVDRSEIVVGRNRYANVQPWDASRIKLKNPLDGSDYVNASPILLHSHASLDSSGHTTQISGSAKYIATQGPKAGQFTHFWHLVHQETTDELGIVVMLTSLVEEGKEKCDLYYPAELDAPTMFLDTGDQGRDQHSPSTEAHETADEDLQLMPEDPQRSEAADTNVVSPNGRDTVTLLSKEYDPRIRCEVRKFLVNINEIPKTIMHFYFARWPDFGKPSLADRKALVELCRRTYTLAGTSPRVVHCSAGVGRTGTWIALDFLLREVQNGQLIEQSTKHSHGISVSSPSVSMSTGHRYSAQDMSGSPRLRTPTNEDGRDQEEEDRIYQVVNSLRDQRMMMVIRDVQFMFLYDVIRDAVLGKYSIDATGPEISNASGHELPSRRNKARRISEDGAPAELASSDTSDADTDILQTDADEQDEPDPYLVSDIDAIQQDRSV